MNLPPSVSVVEVGPRDGFQMEVEFIPTDKKIELVNGLVAAGLRHFEVTSFVSPKAIPQMKDAAQVAAGVERVPGLYLTALVPNPRGAEAAAQAGLDALVVFVSASESHNRANVNRTIEESLEGFKEVARIAEQAGKALRAAIPTSFGCPFEGEVEPAQVSRVIARLRDLGIQSFSLGDTTGMATPPVVDRLIRHLNQEHPGVELIAHFHNTRGIGLVNAYQALRLGVTKLESSVAGLGGCPFSPGASGNISTEDLVYLLREMGIETGVDLDKLIQVANRAEQVMGRTLPGQVMKSGPRLKRFPLPRGRTQKRLAEPPA